MTRKLRAAAYVRVSTTMQAEEGLSLGEQRETLTKRIEAEGWELADVYADEGLSGKRDDRPELERLLRDLPKLDRVVVTELSRLGRRAKGMLDLFDCLEAEDVALVSIRQSIDTSTAAGRLLRNVLVSVAEFESEQLGERVAAVNRSRAAGGTHHGRAPYGYKVKDGELVPMPAEAAAVLRIFKQAAAGKGQRQIARSLNDDRVKPQRAIRWTQSSISAVLRNPTYKGIVVLNDATYDGNHEALVDDDLWNRVAALRGAGARTRNGGPGRRPKGRHLFTRGLLRHECGGAMTPRTFNEKSGTREVYMCHRHIEGGDKACPLGPVDREAIDAAALDYFTRAALDVEAMRAELISAVAERRALVVGQVNDAEREAATAAQRMERVRTAFQDGNLEAIDYREQYAELTKQRAAADARLQVARRREAELVDAEAATQDADPVDAAAERMQVIREAVAGRLNDADGIDAVRAALTTMFESFTLTIPAPNGEPLDRPSDDQDIAAGLHERLGLMLAKDGTEPIPAAPDYVIWPHPKPEVISGLDEALRPVLRRGGIRLEKDDKRFWT